MTIQDCKAFFSSMKEALPQLLELIGKPDNLAPSSLLKEHLVQVWGSLNNAIKFGNICKLWPAGASNCGKLWGQMLQGVKAVLAKHASTFKGFLMKLSGDPEAVALCDSKLVGKLEEGEVSGSIVDESFGQVFCVYFSKMGEADVKITIPGEDKVELHAGMLCFGSCLIPFVQRLVWLDAKIKEGKKLASMAAADGVVLEGSRMKLYGQECLVGIEKFFQAVAAIHRCQEVVKLDAATGILEKCQSHLRNLCIVVFEGINNELVDVTKAVSASTEGLVDDFKLKEIFEKNALEPSGINAACTDSRAKMLYSFWVQSKPGLSLIRDAVKAMVSFCRSGSGLEAVEKLSKALLQDFGNFLEPDLKLKQGLSYTGFVVGSITLAQALVRPLNTGETRQGLAHKALQACKRNGFQCHQPLVQKCEAAVNGRLAA